jgi:hypothetical protein
MTLNLIKLKQNDHIREEGATGTKVGLLKRDIFKKLVVGRQIVPE